MESRLVEVEEAKPADLAEIAQLFDRYRIFYGQPSDVEGARDFLTERHANGESIIFFARNRTNRRIVGFTQLYPVFSSISLKKSLILNDLYVSEESRQQGVGRLLLDRARMYAQEIKAKGLELSTAVDNVTAQRLYEQSGYVRNRHFIHYYLNVTDRSV